MNGEQALAATVVRAVDRVLADPQTTPADMRLWALVLSGCADVLNEAADARQSRDLEASR